MIGERTAEGLEVRLRPRGPGRFFTAAFLAFWLCGWAAGETFVVWILVKGGSALVTGAPPDPGRAPLEAGPALAAGAFLLVWLALWTLGGVGAIAALFQMLWAEDRIVAGSGGITLRWMRGPFRGRREFPRERLRDVEAAPPRAHLALLLDRERVELSSLGTSAEREEAAARLRSEVALEAPRSDAPLPAGWEAIITPEGERAVVQSVAGRKAQARVVFVALLGMSAVALAVGREAWIRPALVPLALLAAAAAAGLAWGAAWLSYGRTELRLGSDRVVIRRRFRSRVRDLFEARRLELIVNSDSDGDDRFELVGVDGSAEAPAAGPLIGKPRKHRRTIASALNDPTVPRMLGNHLARTTGLPLQDRATREAREADLSALLDQLGRSGRFGRVALSLIRKARERQG